MIERKQIPRDKCIDNTLTLLKEGYLFIQNRLERYSADLFETRLLGKRAICISGKEASKLFYNSYLMKRKGALPKRVQKTLFGENAIQTMDGRKHLHRKELFMSILNQEQQDRLTKITTKKWQEAIERWEREGKVIVLYDEVNRILCQSVCEWAGVPLSNSEINYRSKDFSTMVNTLSAVGPEYWRGKKARRRTEKWIRGMIEGTRSGKLKAGRNSALHQVAYYKDFDGKLLNTQMAAVELINVLRPIVAISTFITFTAFALYEHKEYVKILRSGNESMREMFVQEVRRYYPFTPFLGAITRKNFMWNGYSFKKGTLVILDVYGTNHDSRIWKDPYKFRPERFSDKKEHIFDFVPQGGGDPSKGHRCPGEGVTIELMKVSLNFLVNKIEFKIPNQDLYYSPVKIPSLPESGFIMRHIKTRTPK